MKLFWFIILFGLAVYYFIVQAFKLSIFNAEMLLHTLYHYATGFIILSGCFVLSSTKKTKSIVIGCLAVTILFIDEIYDYRRGIENFNLMLILYNLYVLFWGALSGVAFIRLWRLRHTETLATSDHAKSLKP